MRPRYRPVLAKITKIHSDEVDVSLLQDRVVQAGHDVTAWLAREAAIEEVHLFGPRAVRDDHAPEELVQSEFTTTVSIYVRAGGTVRSSFAFGGDPSPSSCLADVIPKLRFPASADPYSVDVDIALFGLVTPP